MGALFLFVGFGREEKAVVRLVRRMVFRHDDPLARVVVFRAGREAVNLLPCPYFILAGW